MTGQVTAPASQPAAVPAAVAAHPRLGTWLTVEPGSPAPFVVRVGKVELGQGILTALAQVAADALGVPLTAVRMPAADTRSAPDQGITAGSLSVSTTAPALRHVGGVIRALVPDGAGDLAAYAARVAALGPDVDLTAVAPAPAGPAVAVGTSRPRLDLPDKVLGRPRYLADLRPAGLLHGRVLRPPSVGARLVRLDAGWRSPGVTLVRDGGFVGVVGEREVDVDRAVEALARDTAWDEHDALPDEAALPAWLRSGELVDIPVLDEPGAPAPTHIATYTKPFLVHGSIAPSAAMAQWSDGGLRVWSHSQGIGPLRAALAAALGIPAECVHVQHVENAGCYGHNAADDAAFDAAVLARAAPGRPVLVRWSRADEMVWGPLSSAMVATVAATLVDGRIAGWCYDVWSQGHTARPGFRGSPGLLGAAALAEPVPLPAATDPPLNAGGGTTRNAVPLYALGPRRVTGHRKEDSPLRTSAMRSLGAYLNVFAAESFVDELAALACADPVDFRLAHLTDERARHVVRTAGEVAGWHAALPSDTGRGLGFARYKDTGAYCAVVAEVEATTRLRVRRLVVVADIGEVVNPEGARNQLEGGAVQATSWTTKERVRFDRRRLLCADWESYPILRATETPAVEVHLVASAAPPLGAGEAAQGPTAAAIANALDRALGVRVRDLPVDTAAILAALPP